MRNQVNGKYRVVNGSINPSLTLEELLQFSTDEKRDTIHSLQVHGHYFHHFQDIDHDVFEPLPDLYTYQQIKNEFNEIQVDEALKDVFNRLRKHEQTLRIKTEELHFQLGKEIFEARRKLKFNGEFVLSKGQLLGFVLCIGNWNDFNVLNVHRTINFLHNDAPRKNFGDNNPNTGQLNHKWSIQDDFIFMDFGYNFEKEAKDIEAWFKTIKYRVEQLSKADSVRLAVEDAGHGGFMVRLVLWWD